MQPWHFNVLFVLGCAGAVALLAGDKIGLNVRPEVVGVYGLILAFVFKQFDKDDKNSDSKSEKENTHG